MSVQKACRSQPGFVHRSDESSPNSFLLTDQLADVLAIPPLQQTAGESHRQVAGKAPFTHPHTDKGTEQRGGLRADQHICFSLSSWANEEKPLLPEKRGGEKGWGSLLYFD